LGDQIKNKVLNIRNSNIELLRIIAMLIIVMFHYSFHSGFPFDSNMTVNKLFIQIFGFGGKVGVDIFVIITGYFMVKSKFRINKLIKLLGQIWFYSLIILIFSVYQNIDVLNPINIIHSILPLGQTNWFANVYLILYILIPIINIIINKIRKVVYLGILLMLTILWFFIPTIMNLWPNLHHYYLGFSQLKEFIYLYALGGYIRLYGDGVSKKISFSLIGVGLLGILMGIILIDILSVYDNTYLHKVFYFTAEDNGFFTLLLGLGLFLYFKGLNIPYSLCINNLAATTFGIYLIHDNELFRYYLWQHIFHSNSHYTSPWLFIYAIYTVLLVFFCCAAIDFIRGYFIERRLLKYLNPVLDKWQIMIDRYI
jgi:putative membrane protein